LEHQQRVQHAEQGQRGQAREVAVGSRTTSSCTIGQRC
jgi:hypothetical protein